MNNCGNDIFGKNENRATGGRLGTKNGKIFAKHTPSLRPPGRTALLSPGHVFLFTVMEDSSRTFSTLWPSIFCNKMTSGKL